jgi:class 3 adenylate cyclase/tetratricopeptide (TPR) repeat protein
MRCSNCGSENPSDRKFCGECGTQFLLRCPKCGKENVPPFRFCGECGGTLADPIVVGAQESKPLTATAGERRHLTVMFCDLVGSTQIAAQLDPEEWREIVDSYHRAATEAITRFGGYVAQYSGDGVMAYFGWPEAHDNNAERAARAGLLILDIISKLNEQPSRPKLSARIGIDSGLVVVGASAGKNADVYGDTPNIAARVQAATLPDTVLITAETHRLISGMFVVEDCGVRALKGIERPIQLYRVIRPTVVRGRLEAMAATRGLTPFVGRDDELRLLMHHWERALEGEGQAVIIIGEAGIGKSRLVQHFHEQMMRTPHTWAEVAASPLFQNTPFYPVSQLLRQLLAAPIDEPLDDQLVRLESALELAGLKPAEAIPLIAPLLNLTAPAKYPLPTLLPEQQHSRLLAMLIELMRGATDVQPLVIAAEDLHWADPSTLELLQLLVEQSATARMLLLYTGRPEFRPKWPLRGNHLSITLSRLSVRNVRTMVQQVAARKALSDETVATLVERTGGVPLFVEELTRALLDSGNGKLTTHEIPVTLHDSLIARLDRLGPAKEILQIAAVIGIEFSYELLHAVHPIAESDLQQSVHSLTDAELLYVRGIAPHATYLFKHALIRDAAYEALLRSRRRELHRLVASIIHEKFPQFREVHPEILARQWADAGEIEPAISEWSRAGNAAEARGAFHEALRSYGQALDLVNRLPESAERDSRELQLGSSVLTNSWITRGPSAPDTLRVAEQVTTLAEKAGNLAFVVQLMVMSGLRAVLASRDTGVVAALADQALKLAVREGSPGTLLLAHSLQVQARWFCGDLAGVEEHFSAEVKIADDPQIRQNYANFLSQDFAIGATSAWMRGWPNLARSRCAEMVAVTNANNPYELAFSQFLAAEVQFLLREYEQAEVFATRAFELSEKHRFPLVAAGSKCSLGKVRAQLGRANEGVELLRQGIAGLLKMGLRPRAFSNKAFLAQAQVAAGAILEALETVEQAIQENTDEPLSLPGTFWLRGELQLKQGQNEAAEADFREAIALSRSMGAKMAELCAVMSLARLLDQQQRREEARTMLAEIYNWFTEGFDTADLKDAKALLDELSL